MFKQGCRLLIVLYGFLFSNSSITWKKSFSPRINSILCLNNNFHIVIRLIGESCIILRQCIIFLFFSLFTFFLSFNSSVSQVGKISLHSSRKVTSSYFPLWRNNLFKPFLLRKSSRILIFISWLWVRCFALLYDSCGLTYPLRYRLKSCAWAVNWTRNARTSL